MAIDMLTHFQANDSGLHNVNSITIPGEIINYFGHSEGITQYIKKKAAQAYSNRANVPISDKALVKISNRAMIGAERYADKRKVWNKRRPDERTWVNWKPIYWKAYTANQRGNTI